MYLFACRFLSVCLSTFLSIYEYLSSFSFCFALWCFALFSFSFPRCSSFSSQLSLTSFPFSRFSFFHGPLPSPPLPLSPSTEKGKCSPTHVYRHSRSLRFLPTSSYLFRGLYFCPTCRGRHPPPPLNYPFINPSSHHRLPPIASHAHRKEDVERGERDGGREGETYKKGRRIERDVEQEGSEEKGRKKEEEEEQEKTRSF